jgi:hypothetical protein
MPYGTINLMRGVPKGETTETWFKIKIVFFELKKKKLIFILLMNLQKFEI